MACFRLSSEPLIFLYTIIFTINYTVLPQLVLKKTCLKQHSFNKSLCEDLDQVSDEIEKEASNWWFYLLTGSLVPSVFTVLIWGPVTDVVGRKRAMLFVPFVNAIRALVYLINSYFMNAHPVYLLFGSFLSCFYGEFQGVVALCYACLADATVDILDHRTMRMAFIEASLFLAGVPAGLLSGYLLEQIGYVSVFVLTIGLNVVMLLYVTLLLPMHAQMTNKVSSESKLLDGNATTSTSSVTAENYNTIVKQEVKPRNMNLLNPFHHLKHVIAVITKRECRQIVLPLVCAFGFSVCAVLGELIVQTLYLKNKPFVFTPQMIGYYSAAQAALRGIGVILITQLSFHWFHLNDYLLIFVGLLSQIVCYTLIGISRSVKMVFIVNIAGLAVPVATTTLRSIVTKQVSKDNYGAVLASLEAVDAIAGVITNALSLWTYNLTLTFYSGIVFFSLSIFSLLSLFVVIVTFCKQSFNRT